jgi:dihydrodipicolinate synthase/N-acetylneuraminate lyase
MLHCWISTLLSGVTMNVNGLTKPLRGIVPPMVTPLAGPDALDYPGLARLVERILGGGVQGLFILGTTGDGPALSYRLRQEVIQKTCDLVAGRVPVLVGITDTSYTESVAIAQFAAKAGAQAAVLAPPYYFHVSQRDLLRLVESMVRDCPLPLFLYNMPNLTKMQWEPETVDLASDIPEVIGLKDSSGDAAYLHRALAAVADKPNFTVLVGPEHLLLDGLIAGVHGGVCGGANLMPALFVRLFEAFQESKLEEASMLQKRIVEIGSPLYAMGEIESSYIRGLKGALAEAGVCSGKLPWPFAEADAEERARIRTHLLRYPDIMLPKASNESVRDNSLGFGKG